MQPEYEGLREHSYVLDAIKAIFFACIPISLLLSYKVVDVAGLTFVAGAVVYAFLFPCTDIVGEIWGKDEAKKIVKIGLIAYVITGVLVALAIYLPPAEFFAPNEAKYEEVLGLTPRLVVAAIITYFVAQLNDVLLFSKIRQMTNGKHLWLRNNLSTAVSQAIDTVLFLSLGFGGVFPWSVLFGMMVGQYLVKLFIAAVDTPVVYIVVALIRRRDNQ